MGNSNCSVENGFHFLNSFSQRAGLRTLGMAFPTQFMTGLIEGGSMPCARSRSLCGITLLVIVFLTGCSGEEPAPATRVKYNPYDYNYGKPASVDEFHDDAPSNREVKPGELPTAFVDHAGKPVDLTQYKGDKNVVLVVVRGIPQSPGGVPCPYCIAQTNSLASNYDEFKNRNSEVLVVYPGPTDMVEDFISQSVKKPDLPFPLLLDPDLKVCDRLGIRGDLAKPSTYIVDQAGNIVYAYVGETLTDRPSLKTMFKVLDRLKSADDPKPGDPSTVPRKPGWLERAFLAQQKKTDSTPSPK